MLETDPSCWVWSLIRMWMSPALKDLDEFGSLEWSLCSIFHPTGRKWQRREEDFAPSSGNALFQKHNLPAKRYMFSNRRTAMHYKHAEVPELMAFPHAASLKHLWGRTGTSFCAPSILGWFATTCHGGEVVERVLSTAAVISEVNEICFKGQLSGH